MGRLKIKHFNRNSVFFSWVLSYISILLIPLVISSIVYVQSTHIIENEINRANKAILRQTQQAIDGHLQDVQKLALQIAFNPRVQGFMYTRPPLKTSNRYTANQIFKDLNSYKPANSMVKNMYIYFKYSDFIIADVSIYEPGLFYEVHYDNDDITYQEWHKILNDKYDGNFIPNLFIKSPSSKQITYVKSLPMGKMGDMLANIIIDLDSSRFEGIVRNIKWLDKSAVCVIDNQNEMISSVNYPETPLTISYDALEGEEGLIYSTMANEKVVISYISSNATDWKYISITPVSIFMEKAKYIKRLTIISLILSVMIGGIVAYFLSKKNYDPLAQIIGVLGSKLGLTLDTEYNEYNFINQAISDTLNENQLMSERLENQQDIIKNNFLVKLLKGQVEDMSSSLDIYFPFDNFMVVLIYIDHFDELFSDKDMNDMDSLKLVKFIIKNVIKEQLDKRYSSYVAEIDDLMACIVNIDGMDEKSEFDTALDIISESKEFIQNNFKIYYTAALSDMVDSVDNLPIAYQQALDTMEYKLILGEGEIINYSDIKTSKPVYYYPLQDEQKLMNYIKSGNFEESREVLNEVFGKFLDMAPESHCVTVDMVKCLEFDLISTMIKTLECQEDYEFLQRLNPIERIMECNTAVEMKYQMNYILKEICEYNGEKNNDIKYRFKDDIVDYIEKYYNDTDLNVSKVGEVFGMTPAYISKLFKDETGEGLLDYINKVRIGKAKATLREGDMTIESVAQMVGFYNSSTFIRTFKKYEGITPGKYRDVVKS